MEQKCTDCDGIGVIAAGAWTTMSEAHVCDHCGGSGIEPTTCTQCGGTGQKDDQACWRCNGKGMMQHFLEDQVAGGEW